MDRPNHLYEGPELSMTTQMIFLLLAFSGIMFNLVVLYMVLVRRRKPHSADSILMVLIAMFDLIACLFSVLAEQFRLIGVLPVESEIFCYMDLFIFSTSTFASLCMTSALSFVRYLTIVRKKRYSRELLVSASVAYLLVVLLVIIGRGVTNPLVTMPSGLYCMPYAENPTGFRDVLETMYPIVIVPCPFVIMFSYGSVTAFYYRLIKRNYKITQHHARTKLGHTPDQLKASRHRFMRAHFRNVAELILVIAIYLASILPEYSISIATLINNTYRTTAMDNFAFLCIFSLSLINPIFVLHLNQSGEDGPSDDNPYSY